MESYNLSLKKNIYKGTELPPIATTFPSLEPRLGTVVYLVVWHGSVSLLVQRTQWSLRQAS